MKNLTIVTILLVIALSLAGCGSGPSDSQVDTAIKNTLKNVENATNGFIKNEVKSLKVGNKTKINDRDTYIVEVTITLATKSGGHEREVNHSKEIKMQEINGEWVVLE